MKGCRACKRAKGRCKKHRREYMRKWRKRRSIEELVVDACLPVIRKTLIRALKEMEIANVH